MSRRPLIKSEPAIHPGLQNAGDTTNTKLKKASIGVVDENGQISLTHEFLLNPESWQDTKPGGWIPNNIPGQSDPILQWVSGGARTVSFEALVTNDTAYYHLQKNDPVAKLAGQALSAIGSIASSFLGSNFPPLGGLLQNTANPAENALSIEDELTFYRSLLYPTYDDNDQLTNSPPLIVLYVGATLSDSDSSVAYGGDVSDKTDLWVLVNLDIKIDKQLPNLVPMEATVNFQFMQYRIKSRSYDSFSVG